MITHIVRMSVRPDVSGAQLAFALQQMTEASSRIGPEIGVTDGVFGRDLGDGFDFAAVSRLDDLAAYEAMMNHPGHLEVDRIGLPLVDRFHSIDITDDQDPEIDIRIAEIHRRRFERHPSLLRLVEGIDDYQGGGVPGRQ